MEESFIYLSGQKNYKSKKQTPLTTASQNIFFGNKFRQTSKNNNFNLNSVNIKNENKKKGEFKGNKDDKPSLTTSKNLNPYKKEIKTQNMNINKKFYNNNIIGNKIIKSNFSLTDINFYPQTKKKNINSFNTNKLNSSSNSKYNIKTKKEENIIQQQIEEPLNVKIDEETNKILEKQQINEKKVKELEERVSQLEKDKNKINKEDRKKIREEERKKIREEERKKIKRRRKKKNKKRRKVK